MQFKIQFVVITQDGEKETVEDIAVLNKDSERIEQLGLTLTESKEILKKIQKAIEVRVEDTGCYTKGWKNRFKPTTTSFPQL